MELYGSYDVIVCGAGITGVVASISAARQGSKVLLVEESNIIGGMITGGRMTKPTGEVKFGIFKEMLDSAINQGGADKGTHNSYWGAYSGIFDSEIMYKVVIGLIEDAGVEVLLHSQIVDVVRKGSSIRGLVIHNEEGSVLVTGKAIIDSTGDGNIAALSGAEFSLGRAKDHSTQPITAYFRLLNVNFPRLADYCEQNPEDVREVVLPDADRNNNESYVMNFFMTGLTNKINKAKNEGFNWDIPKNHITMKAGLIPGEMNINITRFHGNGLDSRVMSRAEIVIRKQAYTAFDFLKKYVPGFEKAIFLELAPKVGVRETRRIIGDYLLTESDVLKGARFEDAIGLTNSPIDIHEPSGEEGVMIGVGDGYGVPYRCLLPKGIEGLLTSGRCISTDERAFGSTRNTPVCAITGEAAGVAAALSAKHGTPPRSLSVNEIQNVLVERGFTLGNE